MGINIIQNQVNEDMLDRAASLCRAYLPGTWKRIISSDIDVIHISGGLSNWLYHVKLKKNIVETHPREVLLRLYGQSHGDNNRQLLIQESVIFALLSERKLGPRLYGVFPGGRIEEYIPGRPLMMGELSDPILMTLIAEKMTAIHSLNLPITKEPTWLWDTIYRWLNTLGDLTLLEHGNASLKSLMKKDLYAEVKWLKSYLSQFHSPVLFCHNDFQEGNILMKTDKKSLENPTPSLMIIDYEYCAYNYRAFEMANHFIEWIFDYKHDQYPFYKTYPENYPSVGQQTMFIQHYLSKMGSSDSLEMVLDEVKRFTLASHLFWTAWSLFNGKVSKIRFGYWEYGAERLQMYFSLKSQLLTNGLSNGVNGTAKH